MLYYSMWLKEAYGRAAFARTTENKISTLTGPTEAQSPPDDGSEDELSPAQPDATLPIQDGDDSFDAPPPRLSMQFDDDEQTSRSIEMGRRLSTRNSLSRGSFGAVRYSGDSVADEDTDIGLSQVRELPADDIDELSGLDPANQRFVQLWES